jgi:ABC-type Zn uptake system ZnuABC Zn-binding protein ZnuA
MLIRQSAPRVAFGVAFLGLLATLPLAGCGSPGPAWPNKPGPKVVASFPPIYCFALNVAGDDAAVRTVMSNQGPHHFDPQLSDAQLLRGADLFFINGLGLDEKVAAKLKGMSGNPNLEVIELGEKIDPKLLAESCGCEHDHGDAHDEKHDHDHDHATDPHVWLGLDLAEIEVNGIRDGLKQADPAHAAEYDRRAAEYVARLKKLEADGRAMLKDKKERKFVTFHGSLTYFARSFGLEIAAVIQKVPGKEPTGKELEALVKACVENKVRVIAVEPQYSGQSSAQRILTELKNRGVENPVLVEIDPMETAPESDLTPGWYEAKMRANLEQLAGALK